MKIIIDTPEKIAEKAALRYVELLSNKPDAILGLATGSTPVGLYNELVKLNKEGKISFKNVTTFNLDEYVGLEPTHDQSYRYFMNQHLLSHVDVDMEKTNVPSGINLDEAASYDSKISSAGGIDLQLLGIGNNGHIGFNEPGTPFGSETHLVDLTDSTREANARFFASIDDVPTQAVTMGIKTVMNAKSIILIALGKAKAEIIKATLQGEVTPEVPASILQLHPYVEVYLDHEAASLLD
ncbi:MAG: glucosamine-6-phosphate deaminase [Ruminococcaceae bacterium]|nr:glucosamine-6-phosphate deaminase [Oscillospiraceae bacterium]